MPIPFLTHQQNFLEYLQFQKRYSKHTIISYETDLKAFGIFMYKEFPDTEINKIKTAYIRTWLASLKENEISSRSLNRKISTLRSFFKFLLQNNVVNINPVSGVISQKTPKRLPQFVSEKDTNVLLTSTEFSTDFKGLTEKLIIEMLYATGMRKAELLSLRENSIDCINSSIKVLGKGNKERIIPINTFLINKIRNYIEEKKKLFGGNATMSLFVNEKGEKFDPKSVYNIVKKYLSKVTTIEKKSPHVLRHSFATHLMNNGADLNAVKELLGHSSLAATQIYTHNTIEKLKDIYKKAHPKG
jgi:integrase/recombinase XerC